MNINRYLKHRFLVLLFISMPSIVLGAESNTNGITLHFNQSLDNAIFEAGSDIPISVSADNENGIRFVRLFVNGRALRKDRSAPYEWGNSRRSDRVLLAVRPGTYRIQALAVGKYGARENIRATFTVEAPPVAELSFAQALDGETFDSGMNIPIGVNANDPRGIRFVQLFVNGQALNRDHVAPYEWPNARRSNDVLRSVTPGTYTVQARAVGRRGADSTIFATFTVEDPTLEEQPQLIWADSYSVGDQCYCMSEFDQGIANQIVDTPYGQMTVPQVCADIGPGPGFEGQPLYNDVQCGNGPANAEENEASCPGRVDIGAAGCSDIGPTWKYPDPVITSANPPFNDGPLQNPLKGFHIGFDASCCLEFPQEVYFGNFMASVGYQNFSWADLEPSDDEWNWDFVENKLSESAGSKNKHVIVQLNAEWTRGDIAGRTPDWFVNDPRFEQNVDEARGYKSHKYESAFYQEEVKEFIAEFIHRWKDDPRVFIIQMGMVGYFGEFNVFPNDDAWLPEYIKVDFFNHYTDHIYGEVARNADGDLVVVRSAPEGSNSASYNGKSALTQVRYPAELGYNIPTNGTGYTNGWINFDVVPGDLNNDDDIGNKDFNDPIDTIVADDGRRLWQLGPIGGEWPPNREPGIEGVLGEWTEFWSKDSGGGDYIRRGHYSFARPPQIDTISRLVGSNEWRLVPEGWDIRNPGAQADGDSFSNPGGDLFRSWHRQMGYNYQLSDIQHYFVANNSKIGISFIVDNVGLAPFYFDWNVELAILDAQDQVVQLIPLADTSMRGWAEGEMNTVSVVADLNVDVDVTQNHRIALRMSQPGATDVKDAVWKIDPKFTYITISNDVEVVEGTWDSENRLMGGWNILDTVTNQGS